MDATAAAAGTGTFEKVVWATDGSEGAEAALGEAIRLARLSGGRVLAIHCDQRLDGRPGGWLGLVGDDRRLAIRRRVDELRRDGVDVEVVIRRTRGEAADTVAEIAGELGADVIVCGTRGLGALAGAFLGSFTQRLLHIAPCPVLAVPGRVIVAPNADTRKMRVEHESGGATRS